LEGVVVNDVNPATISIEREMLVLDRKYKRYFRKYSKTSAHKTHCRDVKKGDKVRLGETRKIAKHIFFVVIENLGANI
jgi:small subunit ribosomal protein S17